MSIPVIRPFDNPLPNLKDMSILITGGTGSFGQSIAKAILERFDPRRVIIFSRDEMKQSDMAQVLPPEKNPAIRYFIGDVRDRSRLEMALMDVDIVVHAAALKQVPAAEYNPIECINTNVLGAENVVQASILRRVKKVISLSTDKAANPINLYGASKLASDKIFVAANNLSGLGGPRFSVVRYGNVINSRGSVIPLFRKLIGEGATSIPITDPRMTRFWITLNQCVNFVLSSLEIMRGGEIFIPKIPSMTIIDLATAVAPDLPQHTVGIRPGEKLHEVMIPSDDSRTTIEMADRFVIGPAYKFWAEPTEPSLEGKPVPDDFTYTSDNNTEWLDGETMLALENGTLVPAS